MATIGERARNLVARACDKEPEEITDELSLYHDLGVSRLDFRDVFIAPAEEEFGLKFGNGDFDDVVKMKTVSDLVSLVTRKNKGGEE